MKKISVAMIGLRGIPAKSGGVENVVEHLAPLLVELGCDVTVYCRKPYCAERPAEFRGVKLKYLPTINTKFTETIAHTLLSTSDATLKKYDIIHFHAMGNGLFSIFPKAAGKKTVVTLHGLDYEREKWGKAAKAFLRLSEMGIGKFPSRVISVSDKIRKHYAQKYGRKISFIPNGVDIMEHRPLQNLKRFGLEENKYILFLSRIVPEKEVHTLISAFRKTNTSHKLVIAGDPTHTEEYMKKLISLAGGDERIIFTGALYGDDKREALSNCSFFVLPSTIEGMPIVLLEAMSYSKCPLVSNIEENLDVIGNRGFSFEVRNEKDLALKLEFMLSHKNELAEKGKECRKLVEEKYGWKKIAEETMQIYEELINGRKLQL